MSAGLMPLLSRCIFATHLRRNCESDAMTLRKSQTFASPDFGEEKTNETNKL